jgi:glycosyltransferase involved in cell wall biosynthesis
VARAESWSAADGTPHVLILSQYFWPESFRITEIAESLRDAGCDVSVLTGQPNYPDGKIFDGYSAFGCGMSRHPSGVPVYRVPLAPRGQGSALGLALNYLSFVLSGSTLGPWLLRKRRIDVVFVYGISPILQAIVGIVLRRTHRARLVTWVQDLWPQSLSVTGYLRNECALAVVAAVVRWIYRRSDLLLIQSEAFRPMVADYADSTPIEFYPNPGERAFERSGDDQPAVLQLPAGFNVVFAGNFGNAQSLETILYAAEHLRDRPEVRFVMIGSGGRSAWLEQQVRDRKLGNVLLTGRFAVEQMPPLLRQADVLLVTLARSPIMDRTIPSKVQAYLAAGRPIIASLDGEGARVIAESGAGLARPAEDARALADAVIQMCETDKQQLASMGQAGRDYYIRHFHPDTLARILRERFCRLAAGANIRNLV